MNSQATATEGLRPELDELPERMKKLLVHRGYPIPWFVPWINGEPEFRAADAQRWVDSVAKDLCWICGEHIGRYMVFVLGPMCGITRSTAEPPCHRECAIWSAKNCPFLARPQMVRRQHEELKQLDGVRSTGIAIERNPGVTLLWTTKSYTVFRDDNGKPMIQVGEPDRLEFFREGRKATREEIDESIRTGLPLLAGMDSDERAQKELVRLVERFTRLLPKQ